MRTLQLDQCARFTGGVSICEAAATIALEALPASQSIKFLEIGGGLSTKIFSDIIKANYSEFEYYCIENNKEYCYDIPGVAYINYDLPVKYIQDHKDKGVYDYIDKVDLSAVPHVDFISIDGPDGVARARWYSRIVPLLKEGTIILIDDFHHYKEFSDELDSNIGYQLITEFCNDRRFLPNGQNYVLNRGLRYLTVNDKHYNKTFKIVKVLC